MRLTSASAIASRAVKMYSGRAGLEGCRLMLMSTSWSGVTWEKRTYAGQVRHTAAGPECE